MPSSLITSCTGLANLPGTSGQQEVIITCQRDRLFSAALHTNRIVTRSLPLLPTQKPNIWWCLRTQPFTPFSSVHTLFGTHLFSYRHTLSHTPFSSGHIHFC